ncbi:Uncharacterised protein [Neisseria gonorrhoeae]|uniref:Uncharacterized protein n=1 Tax=Neisseria gonorrhoeae TaxID=485 RepID=A0A378VY08_NEIGO|nr:Uncharacterised protein [Neisseria gonorrhoeae]
MHYADKFQVAFVARKLPQGFVGIFKVSNSGTTCFKMPSFDALTVTNPRGGSMPLVALAICELVSDGMSAVRVELRRPYLTMSARRLSQS